MRTTAKQILEARGAGGSGEEGRGRGGTEAHRVQVLLKRKGIMNYMAHGSCSECPGLRPRWACNASPLVLSEQAVVNRDPKGERILELLQENKASWGLPRRLLATAGRVCRYCVSFVLSWPVLLCVVHLSIPALKPILEAHEVVSSAWLGLAGPSGEDCSLGGPR